MRRYLKVSVLFLLVTAVFSAAGYAVPTTDGFFDISEGYTSGNYIDYRLDSGQVVATGQLWTFQDAATNDLYAALIAPRSIVDNSYGDNSIGWKEKKAGNGRNGKKGPKENYGHKFSDLLCSDKASFVINDGSGNLVIDFDLDYIGVDETATSGYSSLGIADGGKGAKADGELNKGSAGALLEWGTSLDYNFNQLGYVLTEHSPYADSDYGNVDENYDGWVFDVVYEFRIDGAYLGSGDYQVGGLLSHVSPAKTEYCFIEIGEPVPPQSVPAPGAVLLTGLGTACVGWIRRNNILQ